MNDKNIVIAGGGFGGLKVLKTLSRYKNKIKDYQIILIDKKEYFEFIPMIPDVLAGWLSPDSIQTSFTDLEKQINFKYIQGNINKLDLVSQTISINNENINYHYLVLATGVDSNFFGNQNARINCFRLKTVQDTLAIQQEIINKKSELNPVNIVIVGGGYTGLEAATNAKLFTEHRNIKCKITIVEVADKILQMVPESLRSQAKEILKELDIEIKTENSLETYDGDKVLLRSGAELSNAVCIWTVGTKTPDYIQDLDLEKNKGRIIVEQNLTPANAEYKNVFAIGDTAYCMDPETGASLRMAIQFSINQGFVAGKNIISSIKGKNLNNYNPLDLGYLIPLAYGAAPGYVLGVKVGPRIGFLLHYLMCIARASWQKKFAILQEILSKRPKLV